MTAPLTKTTPTYICQIMNMKCGNATCSIIGPFDYKEGLFPWIGPVVHSDMSCIPRQIYLNKIAF